MKVYILSEKKAGEISQSLERLSSILDRKDVNEEVKEIVNDVLLKVDRAIKGKLED